MSGLTETARHGSVVTKANRKPFSFCLLAVIILLLINVPGSVGSPVSSVPPENPGTLVVNGGLELSGRYLETGPLHIRLQY